MLGKARCEILTHSREVVFDFLLFGVVCVSSRELTPVPRAH